jgi:GNAT superfamily N-acetyltransferase
LANLIVSPGITKGTHPTLRLATLEDVPYILDLSKKLYQESPYKGTLNPTKMRAHLERAVIERGKYLVLVSFDGDKVVGAVVAYTYQPLFSDDWIAIEVLLYLEKTYRASTRGVELIEAFEYWAKMAGCQSVQFGVLTGFPKALEKLYERRGGEMTERLYTKVLS